MKSGLDNPTGVVGATKFSSPLSMPPKSAFAIRPLVLLSLSLVQQSSCHMHDVGLPKLVGGWFFGCIAAIVVYSTGTVSACVYVDVHVNSKLT